MPFPNNKHNKVVVVYLVNQTLTQMVALSANSKALVLFLELNLLLVDYLDNLLVQKHSE